MPRFPTRKPGHLPARARFRAPPTRGSPLPSGDIYVSRGGSAHTPRDPLHSFGVIADTDRTLSIIDPEQIDTQETSKPIVVCVDDDRTNLNALGRVLRARCTVLLATDGLEALELVKANPDVACVLADLRMPGLAGPELLSRVAEIRPHCRRAVVTGYPESADLIAAINAGHLHYVITKPWKLQDILQVVDQLIVTHRLERDNHRLLGELRMANQQLREHEQLLEQQLE